MLEEVTEVAEQTESSKKKVLVADDDPSILYSVKRVLGNSHVVIEASNGEEAVNLAQSHKPDIILMDMMMPEKDGLTACAEIKANEATKAIPIIMLTGVDHELNKELAKSLGASGYVAKPFKPRELRDTISNHS
jgi:CheY-like chemotaxis protein